MTDDRDPLAERVRAAWAAYVTNAKDERVKYEVVVDIARAEADRAWQEAIDRAAEISETRRMMWALRDVRDARSLARFEEASETLDAILALQRPQQPDKPAEGPLEKIKAKAFPLFSDAEILERAADILQRRGMDHEVYGADRLRLRAGELRAHAQPAPDVDATVADILEAAAAAFDTEPGTNAVANWFGGAIKALEEIASAYPTHAEHGIDRCIVCAPKGKARQALTELRERARRVTG